MSLIYFMMAFMTQGSDSVVVRFDAFAFPVPKLITVSCYNSSVFCPAVLTGGMSDGFKKVFVSVYHFSFHFITDGFTTDGLNCGAGLPKLSIP